MGSNRMKWYSSK